MPDDAINVELLLDADEAPNPIPIEVRWVDGTVTRHQRQAGEAAVNFAAAVTKLPGVRSVRLEND